MKLSTLIKKLQSKQKDLKKDPEVIIDYDENGWFEVDKVEIIDNEDYGDILVNLKSSNES